MGYIRITRPDIRAALSIKGQRLQNPTLKDSKDVTWIAAYLCTTSDIGLTFRPGSRTISTRIPPPINGSSDASWSTEQTAQSRLGYMLRIGEKEMDGVISAPIFVSSKREANTVSTSTCTSELHAAVQVVEANERLRGMLQTYDVTLQ